MCRHGQFKESHRNSAAGPSALIHLNLTNNIPFFGQDSVLFHDTIFYNINYGNLQASENQVIEASKMAEIHPVVLNMPQGSVLCTQVISTQKLKDSIAIFFIIDFII